MFKKVGSFHYFTLFVFRVVEFVQKFKSKHHLQINVNVLF